MKERVLSLDLKGAVEAFLATRWKFFNVNEEVNMVRIEVPRGSDEAYVVELPYRTENEEKQIVDDLLGAGFIKQMKRITTSW